MQNLHITVSVKFSFIENICNVAGYDRLVLLKPSSISCGIIMYWYEPGRIGEMGSCSPDSARLCLK